MTRRERHDASKVVVVADAGMLSAANLNKLEDAGFGFIVGSRTSSAPYDLAEHYAKVENIVLDGETVKTTRNMGLGSTRRQRRVIWQYSHKRKIRNNITLNKQIERAEQIADGKRPGMSWERINKAREYIGLKGYVTNLTKDTVTAADVVTAFKVEASFRMAKTDLRARPMFHHPETGHDYERTTLRSRRNST